MVDLFGLAYSPQKASKDQTTIVEQVPVEYHPQANPPVFQQALIGAVAGHACFARGRSSGPWRACARSKGSAAATR